MLRPGDGQADRALWCAVIATALNDAIRGKPGTLDQVTADRWFLSGPDLLIVCELAGLDGPALRQAYLAGSVRPELMRAERRRDMDDAA
ncbi:hypothetical protein [Paracoccus yeei]|uniref:Uncharacterized protein n=1 Tax=Paracoccus yeei TaxID=147645 RepID=A0A5P2QPK2_9RHOB|nr:hypothetical protein [Paracoccus yeei]QEU07971.1 hypothetical protein FOB51_08100 [Paracoccus yeei]